MTNKTNNYQDCKNVKEISFVSTFTTTQNSDYSYKDLLRISKNWVSYRRNSLDTGNVQLEWSFKNSKVDHHWDYLVCDLIEIFANETIPVLPEESILVNLRINFKNNTHWDLPITPDFASKYPEDYSLIIQLIKRFIPNEIYDYPDVLNKLPLLFKEKSLTKANIKNIKKEDICVLMYAEGGAMGAPGEVCIIDKYGTKLVNQGMFDTESDVSQIEAIEMLFDGFEHVHGFMAPEFKACQINGGSWMYINLGAGNHLYLREDFWDEHGNRILDTSSVERYSKWKALIRE